MQPKYLLAGIVLLFGFIGTAQATPYYVYEKFGGTWQDVNKTIVANDESEDNLCWAFSAANVLAYTGWGIIPTAGLYDAGDIFTYFKDNWTSQGGNILYALNWWFDGTNEGDESKGFAQVNGTGPYGFYLNQASIGNYYTYSDDVAKALQNTTKFLDAGNGVSLTLSTGTSGHAVTVWGYTYIAPNHYIIHITDSADGIFGEQDYDVTLIDNKWFLTKYLYGNYFISEVHRLEIKDHFYHTPEPATFLLFSIGLAGLAATRRRRLRAQH